nr:hypothetical protein [Escherichia coli]
MRVYAGGNGVHQPLACNRRQQRSRQQEAVSRLAEELTGKKHTSPKTRSAGEREEEQAREALLALEAELRTLEKHSGANEKISRQRRDLWKAESQYAVLKEAATKRQLSRQEKSLLAHEKETLEYKRQLADPATRLNTRNA